MKNAKFISILLVLVLALSLMGCTTQWKKAEGLKAEATYSLVGYDFKYVLDGNEITFNYVDAASDDELVLIGETLMSILPQAVSYEVVEAGSMVLKTKVALTEAQFNTFVEKTNALIYDTIYC